MGRHAYLIMAHNQFDLLGRLLRCLDDSRNDIFLHIDKKADFDCQSLQPCVNKSALYFTDRIKVMWGGQSQIEATLILLKASVEKGPYDYYHFISGQDFPLKSQDEIHKFFDEHLGKEFISCSALESGNEKFMDRIRYYHPFEYSFGGSGIAATFGKIFHKTAVLAQKTFHIDRTAGQYEIYGVGSNWFSITDEMARYAVSKEEEIRKNFFHGICADELWLQTLWLNAPFHDEDKRYQTDKDAHPYIQKTYQDIMRAIDFTRREKGRTASPHIWTVDDYEMLKKSELLFCRKVREDKLIDKLENDVLS